MTLCQVNEIRTYIVQTNKRESFAKLFDVVKPFLCGAICVKNLYLKDKMYLPEASSHVILFMMHMRK